MSVLDAFRSADQVLLSGVQGITDLITTPGLINLDFADVKSVMQGAGSALMGIGSARGEDRAIQAAETAISSPLLEASVDGAHGVLLSIQGGSDLGLFEINEAARLVQEAAHPEANIIFGAVIDDALGDEVRVTVIAAGFDGGAPTRRRDERALGQVSGRSVPAPAAAAPVARAAPGPARPPARRPQPLDASPYGDPRHQPRPAEPARRGLGEYRTSEPAPIATGPPPPAALPPVTPPVTGAPLDRRPQRQGRSRPQQHPPPAGPAPAAAAAAAGRPRARRRARAGRRFVELPHRASARRPADAPARSSSTTTSTSPTSSSRARSRGAAQRRRPAPSSPSTSAPGSGRGSRPGAGGVSRGPWRGLDLASHVGDDPRPSGATARRARGLGRRAGPVRPAGPRHRGVRRRGRWRRVAGRRPDAVADGDDDGPEADAPGHRRRGVPLGVLVADCVPVLLADAGAGVVAPRMPAAGACSPASCPGSSRRWPPGARTRAPSARPSAPPPVVAATRCRPRCRRRPSPPVPELRSTTSWGTPALDLRAGAVAELTALGLADVDARRRLHRRGRRPVLLPPRRRHRPVRRRRHPAAMTSPAPRHGPDAVAPDPTGEPSWQRGWRRCAPGSARRAGGRAPTPTDVTLVVVTKTYPAVRRRACSPASASGTWARTATRRRRPSTRSARACDLRWHFIGRLQSNKARSVARYADLVHSVDRPALVGALDRGAHRRAAGSTAWCRSAWTATPSARRRARRRRCARSPSRGRAAPRRCACAGVMAVAPLGADPRARSPRCRGCSTASARRPRGRRDLGRHERGPGGGGRRRRDTPACRHARSSVAPDAPVTSTTVGDDEARSTNGRRAT